MPLVPSWQCHKLRIGDHEVVSVTCTSGRGTTMLFTCNKWVRVKIFFLVPQIHKTYLFQLISRHVLNDAVLRVTGWSSSISALSLFSKHLMQFCSKPTSFQVYPSCCLSWPPFTWPGSDSSQHAPVDIISCPNKKNKKHGTHFAIPCWDKRKSNVCHCLPPASETSRRVRNHPEVRLPNTKGIKKCPSSPWNRFEHTFGEWFWLTPYFRVHQL